MSFFISSAKLSNHFKCTTGKEMMMIKNKIYNWIYMYPSGMTRTCSGLGSLPFVLRTWAYFLSCCIFCSSVLYLKKKSQIVALLQELPSELLQIRCALSPTADIKCLHIRKTQVIAHTTCDGKINLRTKNCKSICKNKLISVSHKKSWK